MVGGCCSLNTSCAPTGDRGMDRRVPSSLQEPFASFTAPRSTHTPQQRHAWLAMLLMAGCAVLGGTDSWEDSEEYGTAQTAGLAVVLDFPPGLPGHDPFRRVLSCLAPDALTPCLIAWTTARGDRSGGDRVAMDG
jgi:hypothetical protein